MEDVPNRYSTMVDSRKSPRAANYWRGGKEGETTPPTSTVAESNRGRKCTVLHPSVKDFGPRKSQRSKGHLTTYTP